jgi:acyl carrier protein
MSGLPGDSSAQQLEDAASLLLRTLADLVRETRSSRLVKERPISLDSSLERDLGLDSLSRAELVMRLERAFGVGLPEQALLAETPREIFRLVWAASGETETAAVELTYQAPGVAAETPALAETLPAVLDWHVRAHPERLCICLYGDGEQVYEELSYRALWQGARELATGLREKGIQPRQRVAIMLPTERGYFFSFFGSLLAGAIPVPVYPPVRPSQIEEHLRRHGKILNNAQASILITVPQAQAVARLLKAQVESLLQVVTVEELIKTAGVRDWLSPPAAAQDIAFLQYTSGSTGDPKGVILSHANLLANLRAMGARIQVRSTDVFVSWLPLYHDMGLIGACLGAVYYAYPLVVMSPLSFLKRPASWLAAIHRHRATLSAAPNFAYELCLRMISDDALKGVDLSSLRMLFNGAEPVSPATMERFLKRFSPFGLRSEALAPVYGLAESSVGLALQPPGRGLVIDRIRRDAFRSTGRALPATDQDIDVLRFVDCGKPLAGHQIRIVDDQGRELPERVEGSLEFRGPSCTSGYFRNPAATHRLFHGDWLDSGDRAYVAEGSVYLTGRTKDIIIRGGRNFYPYELEEAVGGIGGIRKGCVAVFASPDPRSGSERLIVVAETRETEPEKLNDLHRQIQEVSVDLLALPADEVVLVPPHAVLKTSSGKIRRTAVRELYERGTLGRASHALWWQLTRLTLASVLPQVRHWLRGAGESLYAAYAWTALVTLAPFVWLLVTALPRASWRWRAVRGAGRLLAWLTGTSLSVQGLENLPRDMSCVLVANHSSYVDACVLAAVLPRSFSYVAKQELAGNFWVRLALKRMDTLFVERFDLQRSTEEARRVTDAVRSGRSLVFFPEGTFDRMPGLLPFRMGAFVAAAQSGVPVVPVAIRGTRSILRAGSWFPRRGAVRVTVTAPLIPEGNDWSAAVKLKEKARQTILRYCGEPSLGDAGSDR